MRSPAPSDDAPPLDHAAPRSSLSRRTLIAGGAGLGAAVLAGSPAGVLAATKRDAAVERLLDRMSLRERVAQLFMFQALDVRMGSYFQGLLDDVRPGGIIFVQPNIGAPDDIRRFVAAIHDSNRRVPPLIAIDQEGGNVIRLPGDPVPGALTLGSMPDDQVRAEARQRGRFLTGYGFDVNFAPVADVAYNSSSLMYLRSFGSDPRAVADKVAQMVRGTRQVAVIGAAKHFPGHGRTSVDSHVAMPTVDLSHKEWLKTDALPFKAAVAARVEMVMIGHLKYVQWDDAPMSLSRAAVHALRDDLGFEGVVVTDDLGMGALAGLDPFDVVNRALGAGIDLLLYTIPPRPWGDLVDHVVGRVESGDVAEGRVNASVRRLLRLKVDHFGLTGKAHG